MAEPVNVLLVEDNPADVDPVKEGMEAGKILCNLHVAMDGEEALRFLRQEPYLTPPRARPTQDTHVILRRVEVKKDHGSRD